MTESVESKGIQAHLAAPEQRAKLADLYLQALREILFAGRATIRPAILKKTALAELDKFVEWTLAPDPVRAEEHGAELCQMGLPVGAPMRLAQVTRQFCMVSLSEALRLPALELIEAYHNSILQGFIKAYEALILLEQERIRSAFQHELTRYSTRTMLAAEVAQATTTVLDKAKLLQQAVDLIRDRLDVYYAGVFLLDESKQWMILEAGTGEAGQEMIRRGHRLEVGGRSMVGWCVANGQPRITLDARNEVQRYNNPLLPETLSEMALPLTSRGQVIGAITIQSQRLGAFSDQDVTAFQIVADQLTNAIENARLFEQTRTALAETESLYEASRRVTLAGNLNEILSAVVEGLGTAEIKRALLWGIEYNATNRAESFVALASWRGPGADLSLPLGTRFPLQQFPAVALALHTDPVWSNDIQKDDRIDPATKAVFGQQNANVVAILPLRVHGQQVGALMLLGEPMYRFDEKAIRPYMALATEVAIAIENRRLLDELTKSLSETSFLYHAAQAINAQVGSRDILECVAQVIVRQMDHTSCWLALVDWAGQALGSFVTLGPGAMDHTDTRPIPLKPNSHNPAVDAVLKREPVVINDAASDERLSGLPEQVRVILGRTAEIPMMVGDEVLAVMAIQRPMSEPAFTPHDVEMLTAIANQAAIGLQNARLLEQTRDALNEVETTHRRYLREQWSSYLSSTKQRPTGYIAQPDVLAQTVDEWTPEMDEAIRQGKAVVVTPEPDNANEAGSAALAVPIKLRGQPIGVLDFHDDDRQSFSEEELALVEALADQIALALENTRLFDQIQQRAQREQLISQIATKMRSAPDVDSVLRTTVHEIRRALGVKHGAIRLTARQESSAAGTANERKDAGVDKL